MDNFVNPCDRGLEMVESHPKSWKVAVWLKLVEHSGTRTPEKYYTRKVQELDTEKLPFEKERSLPTIIFQGLCSTSAVFQRQIWAYFTSLLKAAEIIEMFPTCGGNIWCKVLMKFTQKLGCFFFKTSVHSAKKILPHDEIVVSGRCCLGK